MTSNESPSENSAPGAEEESRQSRRRFLRDGVAATAAGALVNSADSEAAKSDPKSASPLPREFWEERMRAPDDGKR